MSKNYLYYRAINWNIVEDEFDNAVWERATSLFWLDTRIPIENDFTNWIKLNFEEQGQLRRLLILLTNLSTNQSIEVGEIVRNGKCSQQEVAILNNIQFIEMVNTKAYNRMLLTFDKEINLEKSFEWVDNDSRVLEYLNDINTVYRESSLVKKRFIALCVEGLLNYAYLSYLFELWINKEFNNLGTMLEMIIRNESLHCFYFSHKVKLLLKESDPQEVERFKAWSYETVNHFVKLGLNIIGYFYYLKESKKIAKNLILQEANNILMGIGLKEQYSFNDEVLKEINYRLNNLRMHHLSISSNKSTSTNEEIMEESDYEF